MLDRFPFLLHAKRSEKLLNKELGCGGVSYTFTERKISEQRKSEIEAAFYKRFPNGNDHYMWRRDESKLNHAHYEAETPEIWAQEYQDMYEKKQEAERIQREAEQARQNAAYEAKTKIERELAMQEAQEAEKAREVHPVKDGSAYVHIEWMEGFSEVVDRIAGHDYSVESLYIFERMDKRRHASTNKGYDKMKYTVRYTNGSGEPCEYTDRYDLGDGEDGGILGMLSHYAEHGVVEAAEALEALEASRAPEPATIEQNSGGKVIDFMAYKRRKQEAIESEQQAEHAQELEEARETTLMAIQMMDNAELTEAIIQCAKQPDKDRETRQGMCRILLMALQERSRPDAIRVFEQIKDVFN